MTRRARRCGSSTSRSGLAILEAGRVLAIMCACRSWADCHRAYVAEQMVQRRPALRVTHL